MPETKTLIVQICLIIAASHLVGWLLSKVHQPQVVGEMVAGILLGPSLLGWAVPRFSAAVFPPESLGFLSSLSQVGLLLFMFLVGLELDTEKLYRLGRIAVVISQVSILVPFVLGVSLGLYLHVGQAAASAGTPPLGFVLFMGAAMSVTAFPVLARILSERNLLGTRVGVLTIACAAVDDVTAWCLLAAIVAVVRSEAGQLAFWQVLAGLVSYLAIMLIILRPALAKLWLKYGQQLGNRAIGFLLIFLLASSLVTEWLGVHALFGAFLAGLILPKEQGFIDQVSQKFHPLVVNLLVPLFFAITGLRTSVQLISSPQMIFTCMLIIVAAVTGKLGGSMFAARAFGIPWREAAAIGILINTRGLVELVILNVGLEIGVLSQPLFTIMVLMAVVTTLMTTPLLSWVYGDSSVWHAPSAQLRPSQGE